MLTSISRVVKDWGGPMWKGWPSSRPASQPTTMLVKVWQIVLKFDKTLQKQWISAYGAWFTQLGHRKMSKSCSFCRKMSEFKVKEKKTSKSSPVVCVCVCVCVEAVFSADWSSRRGASFEWSQGQKVIKKGFKMQHFQGEKATCQKMHFWNASPVAFGNTDSQTLMHVVFPWKHE